MNAILAKVNLKSKVLFVMGAAIIIASLFMVYNRYIVSRDYDLLIQVACDPQLESCFVGECDHENDSRCEGEATRYYKVAFKKAYEFPPAECTENDHGCRVFDCSANSQAFLDIADKCSSSQQ